MPVRFGALGLVVLSEFANHSLNAPASHRFWSVVPCFYQHRCKVTFPVDSLLKLFGPESLKYDWLACEVQVNRQPLRKADTKFDRPLRV